MLRVVLGGVVKELPRDGLIALREDFVTWMYSYGWILELRGEPLFVWRHELPSLPGLYSFSFNWD